MLLPFSLRRSLRMSSLKFLLLMFLRNEFKRPLNVSRRKGRRIFEQSFLKKSTPCYCEVPAKDAALTFRNNFFGSNVKMEELAEKNYQYHDYWECHSAANNAANISCSLAEAIAAQTVARTPTSSTTTRIGWMTTSEVN